MQKVLVRTQVRQHLCRCVESLPKRFGVQQCALDHGKRAQEAARENPGWDSTEGVNAP